MCNFFVTDMHCPDCHSTHTVKNGLQPKSKKQKHLCQDCGRQFVAAPDKQRISDYQKRLIDLLLLERISLRGIGRVVGVLERWLQYYINGKYAAFPRQVALSSVPTGPLLLKCDEMWSFVGNKQWVWLALDKGTRAIVGAHVGDRSRQGAQVLWDSLPEAYRQSAAFYTDFWEAYRKVFPEDRHTAVGKETGLTNHTSSVSTTLCASAFQGWSGKPCPFPKS